jgi:hypothetical protein
VAERADAWASGCRLEAWFVLAALLSPVGYVLQDVVADAMTVEAVPRVDEHGQPLPPEEERRLMNTTCRPWAAWRSSAAALLVSLVNVVMFQGVESDLPEGAAKAGGLRRRSMAWRW